jgi:hypothetical protein
MIKRRKTVGFFLKLVNNSCYYSEITGSKDNSLLKQNQLVFTKIFAHDTLLDTKDYMLGVNLQFCNTSLQL